MTEEREPSAAGLSFTDNISLAWKLVDHALDENHLALVNESNEAFLRAVTAIGEFARDVSDDAPDISQEMARLDAKLNLLLALAQLEIARKALRSMGRSYHQIGADALRDMAAVKRGKRGAK